jgi:hypothetical protein
VVEVLVVANLFAQCFDLFRDVFGDGHRRRLYEEVRMPSAGKILRTGVT